MANSGDLNRYIDERLRDYRPDRYQSDDPFFDRVIDSVPDEYYDLDDLLRSAKRDDVKKRESRARNRANSLLRHYHLTGQLELHWRTTANEPLRIDVKTIDDDGNEIHYKEYVALRAASPDDLRAWADAEESDAQKDYEARIAGVAGAREFAAAVAKAGMHQFYDWANEVDPEAGAA